VPRPGLLKKSWEQIRRGLCRQGGRRDPAVQGGLEPPEIRGIVQDGGDEPRAGAAGEIVTQHMHWHPGLWKRERRPLCGMGKN